MLKKRAIALLAKNFLMFNLTFNAMTTFSAIE
jgi:hypothetical protein